MPKPWEKSQQAAAPAKAGPWQKYQPAAPEQEPQEPGFWQSVGNDAAYLGRKALSGALAIPEMVHDNLVAAPVNAVSEAVGSDYRIAPAQQQLDYALNAAGVPNPQPEGAVSRIGGDVAEGVGGALGGLGVAKTIAGAASPVVSRIGQLLADNPGAQVAATAAGSGASGASRELGASPGVQLAAGAVGALSPAGVEGAKGAITAGARRLLESPDAETLQLAQKAAQRGIRLTAPQVSPSRTAKLLDSGTSQVPFSGGERVRAQQQQQFNRAVGRTFGAESDKITPDVFRAAKGRISAEFNRLTSRNDMRVTPELADKLRSIAEEAAAFGDDATHNAVMSAIARVNGQSVDGALPGHAYQSIDSMLGNISKRGGEKAHYLGEVREALRDAMGESISPKDQAAWKAARQAWRNMKTVEPLVAKSPSGDISPAGLMGRVTSNAPGKVAMAQGSRGDLGDLARIGQQFLKSQVPDSGTARRMMLFKGLKGLGSAATGAGAVVAPMSTLGAVGTAVGAARATQRLLQSKRLLDALTEQANNNQALRQKLIQSTNPTANTLAQQNQ